MLELFNNTLNNNTLNNIDVEKNWRYNTTLLYTIGNSKRWRNCIAPSDAHLLMSIPHSKYSNNKQLNISR